MNLEQRTKKITIFEGPDGGGKSTAAKEFARATQAHYVHFGPLKGVKRNLGRLFVEAMTPALLGLCDVVMDRSWLSEHPYGTVYRDGRDRLGPVVCRMLERLAYRCGAVVVYCLPDWPVVRANFKARQHDEYLPTVDLLRRVYELYVVQRPSLPWFVYDYTKQQPLTNHVVNTYRTPCHLVDVVSVGHFKAPYTLVGEQCREWSDIDAWYRWPFGSFDIHSTGYWLTAQLMKHKIDESDLLWVNTDQLAQLSDVSLRSFFPPNTQIHALSMRAGSFLTTSHIDHLSFDDPRTHRRTTGMKVYPLLRALKLKRSNHE